MYESARNKIRNNNWKLYVRCIWLLPLCKHTCVWFRLKLGWAFACLRVSYYCWGTKNQHNWPSTWWISYSHVQLSTSSVTGRSSKKKLGQPVKPALDPARAALLCKLNQLCHLYIEPVDFVRVYRCSPSNWLLWYFSWRLLQVYVAHLTTYSS